MTQKPQVKRDSLGRFLKGSEPWNKGTVGICKPNISSYKRGHKLPRGVEKRRIANLYRVSPNLKPTANLAYLLGVLKGDGYVNYSRKYNRCIVGLQNTELKFCKNFTQALKAINLNPSLGRNKKLQGLQNHRLYYTVACSQIFYKWYKNLSLKKLKTLLDVREKKTAFIRGFYESEGSLFERKDKKYRLTLTNTNKKLLELVKSLLEEVDFIFNLNGPYEARGLGRKSYYRLDTSKQSQIKEFIKIINPSIKRDY